MYFCWLDGKKNTQLFSGTWRIHFGRIVQHSLVHVRHLVASRDLFVMAIFFSRCLPQITSLSSLLVFVAGALRSGAKKRLSIYSWNVSAAQQIIKNIFRGRTMLGRFNSGKVSFAESRQATGRTNLANKNFPSAGNEQFQKNTFRILRNYIVVKLNKWWHMMINRRDFSKKNQSSFILLYGPELGVVCQTRVPTPARETEPREENCSSLKLFSRALIRACADNFLLASTLSAPNLCHQDVVPRPRRENPRKTGNWVLVARS